MPFSSASCVTVRSFFTSSSTVPTGTVIAESPKKPSSLTPMSSDTISPERSGRLDGIPWTTWSLTEAHSVDG